MSTTLDILKNKFYFTRLNILFNKRLKDGKITRFEEETIWVRMEKEKKVY